MQAACRLPANNNAAMRHKAARSARTFIRKPLYVFGRRDMHREADGVYADHLAG